MATSSRHERVIILDLIICLCIRKAQGTTRVSEPTNNTPSYIDDQAIVIARESLIDFRAEKALWMRQQVHDLPDLCLDDVAEQVEGGEVVGVRDSGASRRESVEQSDLILRQKSGLILNRLLRLTNFLEDIFTQMP